MLNYFQDVQPEILDVSDTEIDIGINVIEKQTGKANFWPTANNVRVTIFEFTKPIKTLLVVSNWLDKYYVLRPFIKNPSLDNWNL